MPENPDSLTVNCSDPSAIIGAVNSLMPRLGATFRKRLNRITLGVLRSEGVTGVYKRFNGRTVADILSTEFAHKIGPPIETAERDGVKYTLYDSDPELRGG